MRVMMLGVNHRTAPIQLRERLALEGEPLDRLMQWFRQMYPTVELVVLSTCNRTELYLARASHEPPTADDLRSLLQQVCGVDTAELVASTLVRENEQAAAHLFRVASGLDSMVLGEPQVLGQVKRAYEHAAAARTLGPALHRMFQQAIAVAKDVRTRTGIGEGRVSIGSVAVDFARQIFDRFDDKTIVGIGAGDMAKLALKHLHALQPARLWLVNRSPDRAQLLADRLGLAPPHGGVRPLDALNELLIEADIVLTSTASPLAIITVERFGSLLRKRRGRPLFIIDIAVPRDVEPAVGSLSNVYLYNIDDLQAVVGKTHENRGSQVQQAQQLLTEAVRACMSEIQNRDIGQLIRALRDRLHEVGQAEQARTLRKLAALPAGQVHADAAQLVEEHTHRLINKILHMPLSQLDSRKPDAPLGFYAAALRRLFDLDVHPAGPGGLPPASLGADNTASPHQATGPNPHPLAPPAPPMADERD